MTASADRAHHDLDVQALHALTRCDLESALESAGGSRSLLGRALERYLATDPVLDGSVYTDPQAFQAFIAGGGNVELYARTSAALADRYLQMSPATVLDIGCGDGMALIPALQQTQATVSRVHLVEPSTALLETAVERITALGIPVSSHGVSIQDFVGRLDPDARWDVAQSTFALHALPPAERDDVLRTLHQHMRSLAIVEFDVATAAADDTEHLDFLARSYEQGLAEYAADRDLVAHGFLMPVLVGQLLPGAARMTHEQTAEQWSEQLTRCGYRDVRREELHPYWSSPAFLITATS